MRRMHKYIYRLVFTELGRIFLFQLFRSLRLLEDRWFTLEICFYAHCAHRYDRCSGKIFFFFDSKKKNCSPSIPTPLSFFHPSLVPFIFSPHFIFSPFDCHRFIQLSFTDKRARSHRLYRRAAIECSLPFLFNAYSINWRGITSNDFIGRWIKQIMPARKVETT